MSLVSFASLFMSICNLLHIHVCIMHSLSILCVYFVYYGDDIFISNWMCVNIHKVAGVFSCYRNTVSLTSVWSSSIDWNYLSVPPLALRDTICVPVLFTCPTIHNNDEIILW